LREDALLVRSGLPPLRHLGASPISFCPRNLHRQTNTKDKIIMTLIASPKARQILLDQDGSVTPLLWLRVSEARIENKEDGSLKQNSLIAPLEYRFAPGGAGFPVRPRPGRSREPFVEFFECSSDPCAGDVSELHSCFPSRRR